MPDLGALLHNAKAVAFSWHGVLFDRDRRAIHAALAETFARWTVIVTESELVATRGPTGRPQIDRLFALPRVAEAFRTAHGRWATSEDLAAMTRDLEPRLIVAATVAAEPNRDACALLERLRARGLQTAVICCTPRRLLGPQLEALARAGLPIDCVLTADETCEPAPEPWGIFEASRRLGLERTEDLVLIDDSPAGASAARNAGARSIALTPSGASASDANATLRSLEDV